MAFNIKEYIETETKGLILVEMVDFEANDKGEISAYVTSGTPSGSSAKISAKLDRKTFKYANKSVADAFIGLFIASKKAKSEKTMQSFLDRTGTFKKIADKENADTIKEAMKKLSGFQLEALAMAAEALLEDKHNNFAEFLAEGVLNAEIYY